MGGKPTPSSCSEGWRPWGLPRRITDSQIRSAIRLVDGGDPVAQVSRDLGMSRATFYRRARALGQQPPQEQSETLDTER